MREILHAVYLFLPAGVANAAPPVLARLLGPGSPIDFGRRWRGKELFGAHKTWQGLIGGICAGTITFALQRWWDRLDLPLAFGVAISAGALSGDLVKSFFKRRMAIAPGRVWVPFDQLDYVAGALVAAVPFVRLTPVEILAVSVVYIALHPAVSALGYLLGVKRSLL